MKHDYELLERRMKTREKVLAGQLDGYKEYMRKVKYRLIPGVWWKNEA